MIKLPYIFYKNKKITLLIIKITKEELENSLYLDIYNFINQESFDIELFEIQQINGNYYLILETLNDRLININRMTSLKFKNYKFEYDETLKGLHINRNIYLNFISKDITENDDDYYTLMSQYAYEIKNTEYQPSQYIIELLESVGLEYVSENCFFEINHENINTYIEKLNKNKYGYVFIQDKYIQEYIESFYK